SWPSIMPLSPGRSSSSPPAAHRQLASPARRQPADAVGDRHRCGRWVLDLDFFFRSALAVDTAVVEGYRRRRCRAPAAIIVRVAGNQICRHHAAGGRNRRRWRRPTTPLVEMIRLELTSPSDPARRMEMGFGAAMAAPCVGDGAPV
ncbi:hypothetical protein ACLOJK_003666, partial [Asimina triloba]